MTIDGSFVILDAPILRGYFHIVMLTKKAAMYGTLY